MKNITWTHNLRLRMYEELVNDLGNNPLHFNSRGKPHRMSKAQWLEYLDNLAITLGLPKGKGGALSNQIAWVFCKPSTKCHKGHTNNMIRNRHAALLTGWVLRGSPTPKQTTGNTPVAPVSTSKPSKLKVVAKVAAIVGTGIALAMGIPIII